MPQPKQPLVVRDQLLRRLSAGVERQLTLVHGAAGSGKTLLVADWVNAGLAPGPVAWVTLDKDADAPGPFWAYLLHGLQGCGLSLGAEVGRPARAEGIDRPFLARVAAVLSELSGPVVLVLDEYDAVPPGVVDADLDFVLRNAAPHLRLVVLSRRMPDLRLARYRVAGELTEIGPADLAFTPDEAAELFRLHGVPVSNGTAAALTARTDGWATGLRLSALAMGRGSDPAEAQQVATQHGAIADFILTEVVDEEPPETQDLLLRTCLLERVSGELADALTGRSDGQRRLTELSQASSFVRAVPGAPSWFRYHEIFARALQGRLVAEQPTLVPRLHREASQWLADNDRLTDAVAHAVEAEDWALAAGHVVDHLAIGHLLVGLETHRLGSLFARLPDEIVPSPDVALVRAALAMTRFDVADCVDALDRAEAGADRVPRGHQAALRLGIAAVRVIVSRLTGDLPTAERAGAQARRLMAQVPAERLDGHPELPALVLSSLGTMQLWHGSPDAAEENLRAALAAAHGPFTDVARTNCLGQLAFVHVLYGRLRDASDCALQALQLADRSGVPPESRVPVGHLAAAAVAWEWNDLPATRTHTQQAASSVAALHDPSIAVTIALLRARDHLAHGRCQEAVEILRGTREERARLSEWSFLLPTLAFEEAGGLVSCGELDQAREAVSHLPATSPVLRVALARVELVAGRPDAALAVLGDVPGPPTSALLDVRELLARADALHALHREGEAREQLEQALRLARPDGIRRPFVEADPWVRDELGRDADLAARHSWLGPGLIPSARRAAAAPDEAPALVVEPLSDREVDVLRLVAQPMTSREVAETLHLSVHTVKTHLRSIFRKLSATSRNQAVRRARKLGII
ncbi:MAG TPA: LuxR C-terminal-related transcriptional regulator [Actinomycetes bacterium]